MSERFQIPTNPPMDHDHNLIVVIAEGRGCRMTYFMRCSKPNCGFTMFDSVENIQLCEMSQTAIDGRNTWYRCSVCYRATCEKD